MMPCKQISVLKRRIETRDKNPPIYPKTEQIKKEISGEKQTLTRKGRGRTKYQVRFFRSSPTDTPVL